MKTVFDYIIIGSGLAGLNAAFKASKSGSVLIITKKKLKDANTFYAQGGIAAVIDPKDSFREHIKDTLIAGAYHNNKKTVEFIIKKSSKAIKELEELGVAFDKNSTGQIVLGREGGHHQNRIVHHGDYTGKILEETFIKNIKKKKNITVFENTFAKDLLIKNKTCYGVQIIKKNVVHNIFGKKVILASGGLGQIFLRTTNPKMATGDGIAMAFRAKCQVKDLEFIQFHPTAFLEKKNPQFLLSEALRGEGAKLVNQKNERFMRKYHPLLELAPRDIISRAIFEEEKKGKVYLDFRADALQITSKKASKQIKNNLQKHRSYLQKRFPQIYQYLKKKGYDVAQEFIPITPAAHFSCGGIKTDLKGKTNIKNLYAFGEVACTGLHGANRLASNSLLEAFVMSNEIIATKLPKIKKFPDFKLPISRSLKQKKNSSDKIREKIQKIMWEKVGIMRTQKNLLQAQKELEILQKKLPDPITIEDFETLNMVQTALLITKAALKRKKSLGTHFRMD